MKNQSGHFRDIFGKSSGHLKIFGYSTINRMKLHVILFLLPSQQIHIVLFNLRKILHFISGYEKKNQSGHFGTSSGHFRVI